MAKRFNVYKGLQKPLVYRGFKGKFIYWGLGFLVLGLIAGAVTMSIFSKLLGALVLVGTIVGGLFYTAGEQKKGLHTKKIQLGVYVHSTSLKRLNKYEKKESV